MSACQHTHRIRYTDEGGLYQRCQLCGYETLNCKPIPNERPTTMTTDRLALAIQTLTDLYDAWQRDGGPSPSTADEAIVIAEALRTDPITDEATLTAIWQLEEIHLVAAAHLAAIDEVAR